MADVAERNFNTFMLGDDPTKLADGVIGEIANDLRMSIGEDQSADLGALVGALGNNKELRNNRELTDIWTPAEAAVLLGQTGVQLAMNRSLWTPDYQVPADATIVMTGAVANWQDRAVERVLELPNKNVHMALGNRVMGTRTELENDNIKRYQEDNRGKLPTEFEYGDTFGAPAMLAADKDVTRTILTTGDGQEVANTFMDLYPELAEPGKHVAVARVANAGVQLAVQMRRAARMQNPEFDKDSKNPQLFVATDGRKIAHTSEEIADAKNYQSPYTGLRQAVLTAKLLAETR